MYQYGDLIKIDLTIQANYYEFYMDRWLVCPYVTVYNTQVYNDSVRIEATVYYPDGSVQENAMLKANPRNSILIERYDDE